MYNSQFYLLTAQPQYLMVIRRDIGLITLCHIFRFPCQQWVLKRLPGPGYLHSKDGIVLL